MQSPVWVGQHKVLPNKFFRICGQIIEELEQRIVMMETSLSRHLIQSITRKKGTLQNFLEGSKEFRAS
ncbi:unnamed protein product [Coffea canephora]|uniref:Uncharacterized protein n=1 Tax=Coffea canephora TaxID=49390 RepID=A0A068V868_COFCA|nr:unnamed protein product [Coffea canephora]